MSSPVPPPPEGGRLRLHYLDGLRGLAALHVALHHALWEVADRPGWLPGGWVKAARFLPNATLAVQFFIVLSGYCLMLPVARAGHLKGGWSGFLRRRARRILPPYYAALVLSLAVIALVPGMNTPQGLRWDVALPAFTPGVLGSHLLLLQDLSVDWIYRINSPMWSIAQEWQIYFVFAFGLLPLWRRAGIVATVICALVVSVAIRRYPGHDLTYAAPEFLFLFALGMFAAAINFPAAGGWLARARDGLPWAGLTAGLWSAWLALTVVSNAALHIGTLFFTLLGGAAMLCTLVFCTRSSARGERTNPVLRLGEARPVVALGAFSYSLYLVHLPVLSLFTLAMQRRYVPGIAALGVELFVAVPVAAACAYGFHLVAERPFMPGHPANLKRAEKSATLDPAP